MDNAIYYAKAAAFLGAAIAIGVGSAGPALGQGLIGTKGCESMGKYPESASSIRTAMFLSMAIVETALLYETIIACALVYVGYIL
jgi:F-type H+-transporting ATPase subunit c